MTCNGKKATTNEGDSGERSKT